MAEEESIQSSAKKARQPNFSQSDCFVLCEIMAEESSVVGLTNHTYLRHRFTSNITAASKRKLWLVIETKFNAKADHPRDSFALQKKWDNLVQVHRAMYADFMRDQQRTGGGPCPKGINPITESVMSVIGKKSVGITGISECMDSSLLQLNSLSATSQAEYPLSSASSTMRRRVEPVDDDDDYDEQSRSSFTATCMPSGVTECGNSTVLSSNYSAVQVVCCQCNCHRQLELLKEEKIRLQIRVLKRQLDEE